MGEIYAHDAAWSPDGQEIAYLKGNELYLVKSDGTQSHKLVTLSGQTTLPRWAPDGKRLCVNVEDPKNNVRALWEVDKEGRNPHPTLPGWQDSWCGWWTPDGRYFLFLSGLDLWARREKPGSKPVQLTFPPSKVRRFVPSKDGKKIFISELPGQLRLQLLRYNPSNAQKSEFLMGVSAAEFFLGWELGCISIHVGWQFVAKPSRWE